MMERLLIILFLIGATLMCDNKGVIKEYVLLNVHDTTDEPYTYYENAPGATDGEKIPHDWTSPVDYVGGTYHTRFVIHKMGNGEYPFEEISLLLTIRDGAGRHDAHVREHHVVYKTADIGKGVVLEKSVTLTPEDYWIKKDKFSWQAQPAFMIRVQPRIHVHDPKRYVDINKNKPDFKSELAKTGGLTYEDVKAWFLPMEYDYQAVVVAKGETFAGWEGYPFKSGLALVK